MSQAQRDRLRIALAEVQAQAEHARHAPTESTPNCGRQNRPRRRRPGTVDVERLQAGQQYVAGLRQGPGALPRERATIADEIVVQRERYSAADGQVRTLEKLHEKQHARFRAEEQQRDGRQMDELANRSAAPQFDA